MTDFFSPAQTRDFCITGLFLPFLFFLAVVDCIADIDHSPVPMKKEPPQLMAVPVIASHPPSISRRETDQKQRPAAVPLLNERQARTLNKDSTQGDNIPLLGHAATSSLDDFQTKGSTVVLSAAEWLDSFFDDPRYLAEENRTRVKVKLGLGYSELYNLETYSAINVRVNLPRLEKQANFFLRLNDDSDFDADSSPIPNTEGGVKNDVEKLSAGVQYFLAVGEQYNVSTEAGASLDYLYAGVRYRHLHSLFDDEWSGRFTNRLRYYTDDGWEDKASYDIERHFGERFFYRTTFTAVFSEANEGVPFSAIARLYQVFDIDSALSYDVGTYFNTRPQAEVTDIQLRLRYRQRFYRDWLVLEVAPQITFPQAYDHDINPGIVTKFEFDFGYLSDQNAFDRVFKF